MASNTPSLGDAARAAETVSRLLAAPEAPCSRLCTAPGKIHWWGAGLGDAGCEVIARTLEGPKYVRSHEALKNVLLGGNFLGPVCMQHLSYAAKAGVFREVSSLGLSRNRLGDEGTFLLTRMISSGALQPGIHMICIRSQRSNPSSASQEHTSCPTRVCVSFCPFCLLCFECCAGELYLSNNGISSRGAAALASAISSTPAWPLVKLSIGNNLISGAGKVLHALSASTY
eukprot:376093-Pleurochrysis_carterae.AAC.4